MTILSLGSKISGEYRLVVTGPNQADSGWIPNLVLDSGLDRIGSNNGGMFDFCSVGTGSTAPAVSQTGLVATLASQARTSRATVNLGSTTYSGQYTGTYVFSQGAVVGNVAEMGVGWASGGGSLFSRCLIVDGGGSSATITVTPLDQLTVYYRCTNIPALTTLSSTVTLSGTGYPYTAKLANATSFFDSIGWETWTAGRIATPATSCSVYPAGSTLGAVTSTPSGTGSAMSGVSSSQATYTNGNFYRDTTLTFPPTAGNVSGGIGAMLASFDNDLGVWQYAFSTPIPKDNTKTLTLIIRYTWGR